MIPHTETNRTYVDNILSLYKTFRIIALEDNDYLCEEEFYV